MHQTGPSRVIRNPITGEEILYTKGKPPVPNHNNNKTKPIDYDISHLDRVQSLIAPLPADPSRNKSDISKKPPAPPKSLSTDELSSNLSKQANASSIPLLNFTDLFSEDRNGTESHEFRQKLNEFVGKKNPIVEPSFLEKSAQYKTTYGHQVGKVGGFKESPIITYRNQLSNIPSKLDAPRDKVEVGGNII